MGALNELGLLLGGSWASGLNLYLTIAGLGIAGRAGFIDLPGSLGVISHPLVISVAALMYMVEFFVDKIPYLDSMWDTLHTLIRPAGGSIMAYLASSSLEPPVQLSVALLCGAITLDAHLTKATTRVAINTSPEPFSNIIASFSEDALVVVAIWMVIKHPVIAGILVISFIVFSIWFLTLMFRFLRVVFRSLFGRKKEDAGTGGSNGSGA